MIGRRRQEAIREVLSAQAYEAYIEDAVAHMRKIEVNSFLPNFTKFFVHD